MAPEIDPEDPDRPEGLDSCINCNCLYMVDDLATCDGCGNAVCRACSEEDDFGTTRCDQSCGF